MHHGPATPALREKKRASRPLHDTARAHRKGRHAQKKSERQAVENHLLKGGGGKPLYFNEARAITRIPACQQPDLGKRRRGGKAARSEKKKNYVAEPVQEGKKKRR